MALAACGALLCALVLPLPGLPGPRAAAADPACQAGGDLRVNAWIGPQSAGDVELWNEDENWSLGHYPRGSSIGQVVCIRTAGEVVMPQGAHLRVHVAAIDLGGTGALVVRGSNRLFVDANPEVAISKVAATSRLEAERAVLGGRGRIQVLGQLTLTAQGDEKNVLTTRECARDCRSDLDKRHGTVSVEGNGLLRVVDGPVRVADSYHVVVVGGEVQMDGARGRVIADRGTGLALRQSKPDADDPALLFLNNGGWLQSKRRSELPRTRVRIHGGIVRKENKEGTSSVQGDVSTEPGVNAEVQSGTLAIAGDLPGKITTALAAGARFSTGSCAATACEPVATDVDTQVASVKLPPTANDVTLRFSEEPAPSVLDPLGLATAIEPQDNEPDVGHERAVRLELRYDASLAAGHQPETMAVAVSEDGTTYEDLVACSSTGRIPNDATGCVDRRKRQSRIDGGDLVMVVRTLHFSRYVCH
jgi:hypothetical protein